MYLCSAMVSGLGLEQDHNTSAYPLPLPSGSIQRDTIGDCLLFDFFPVISVEKSINKAPFLHDQEEL